MFPLSETFVFAGIYAVVFAALCLIFLALLPRAKGAAIWGAIVLTGLSLLIGFASNPLYDATTDVVLGLLAFCLTPVLALLWAMIARRFARSAGMGAGVLAAFVPSVVIAGVSFERQIVPHDLCTQSHLPVRVADTLAHLRPELAATVWLDGTPEHLAYDRRARNKEDLRKLCDLSAGGHVPVETPLVLIAPSLSPQPFKQACAGEPRAAFCEGFEPAYLEGLGALQLFKLSETALRYELRQKGKEDALFAGDGTAGYLCRLERETGLTQHCRMWRSLSEDARVLITTKNGGAPRAPEAKLAELDAALSFYLRVLRP